LRNKNDDNNHGSGTHTFVDIYFSVMDNFSAFEQVFSTQREVSLILRPELNAGGFDAEPSPESFQ